MLSYKEWAELNESSIGGALNLGLGKPAQVIGAVGSSGGTEAKVEEEISALEELIEAKKKMKKMLDMGDEKDVNKDGDEDVDVDGDGDADVDLDGDDSEGGCPSGDDDSEGEDIAVLKSKKKSKKKMKSENTLEELQAIIAEAKKKMDALCPSKDDDSDDDMDDSDDDDDDAEEMKYCKKSKKHMKEGDEWLQSVNDMMNTMTTPEPKYWDGISPQNEESLLAPEDPNAGLEDNAPGPGEVGFSPSTRVGWGA
jgi:hypothetical protein